MFNGGYNIKGKVVYIKVNFEYDNKIGFGID